jgi:hypothetical protein
MADMNVTLGAAVSNPVEPAIETNTLRRGALAAEGAAYQLLA